MFGLEPWHIVLLLAVVLVVFGPKRLPEIGKNLGESIREFRKATTEFGDSVKAGATEPAPPAAQAQAASQPPQTVASASTATAPVMPSAGSGTPPSAPPASPA
ncbi:MAG: twin-arginine translocase TatA/TatE family subunit [Chloroflexi bacterium]|nr:twin-arginine translocase TatA/TatE family subunit [Chloroflexota bacterium]